MLSLQNLLHTEDKVLSLLEASAAQAQASVRALAARPFASAIELSTPFNKKLFGSLRILLIPPNAAKV
jgi:hypothetical protein